MLTVLYTELLKCKRASICRVIAAAILIPSLISFAIGFSSTVLMDSPPKWSGYLVYNQFLLNMIIGPPVFALLASFLYAREYEENTVNTIFLYPRRRALFYCAKMILLLVLIATIITAAFLISIGLGYVFAQDALPRELLVQKIVELLKIIGLQFLLAPIATWAGIVSRHVIAGVITGIAGVGSSVILMIASTPLQFSVFNPYAFVTMIIDSPLSLPLMIRGFTTLIILAALSLLSGYHCYVKREVQGGGV